jgi:hypothetical protein
LDNKLTVGEQKVSKVNKQELVDLLNCDLSREYQAIIAYIQYAASVAGPYREELKQFFLGQVPMKQSTPNIWLTRSQRSVEYHL